MGQVESDLPPFIERVGNPLLLMFDRFFQNLDAHHLDAVTFESFHESVFREALLSRLIDESVQEVVLDPERKLFLHEAEFSERDLGGPSLDDSRPTRLLLAGNYP